MATGGQLLTMANTVPLSAGGAHPLVMRTQYALVTAGFTVREVDVAPAIGAFVFPDEPLYHWNVSGASPAAVTVNVTALVPTFSVCGAVAIFGATQTGGCTTPEP